MPSFLQRQKTFKNKTVGGEPAVDKGRNKGSGTRKGFHANAIFDALTHQQKRRIKNPRRSCIGNHSYFFTRQQLINQVLEDLVFIVLVVRSKRLFNLVMIEQP